MVDEVVDLVVVVDEACSCASLRGETVQVLREEGEGCFEVWNGWGALVGERVDGLRLVGADPREGA